MCGIAGFVKFDGNCDKADGDILDAMVATLFHRGPDEMGRGIKDNVAMGMRRLSIIDLSGGSQPIYNEDHSIWTVFNGEIYNFQELRETLQQRGHVFTTRTDTEVIVHAYEEYGNDFPKYLNGMFAIALHDQKKRIFILARDHIGIKPLYYHFSKHRLLFGSEIKSILASNQVDRKLDLEALSDFLSWEYIPGAGTLFTDVRKLEPASVLVIDIDRPSCRPHPYWDIPIGEGAGSRLSAEDWEERIYEQLKKSTQMQLISDVPLGAFLSGGVDSSLMVSTMGPAHTFSIGFDDPTYNELSWARKVASHLGVSHTDEIIQPDAAMLFQNLMHFMDDPIGDFSIFPTYLVSRLARENVTVALSGDGGDELFAGYETYVANEKARIFERLSPTIRARIIAPLVGLIPPTSQKKGLVNKIKRFVEGAEHPGDLGHARWRLFVGELMREALFTEEARRHITSPVGSHISRLFKKAGPRGELNKCLYVDVKSYLCDNILTKVDRMSMAVSLETRVPYLDVDLVELAFKVPENLKLANGKTKEILKRIAARVVPRECIYRPKEGFSIPIKNWLSTAFKPLMERYLNQERIQSEGIFHWATINRLKEDHLLGKANHSHILWALIVFHDWQDRWLRTGHV
jgi:asparagine synthase (glutamine-hydrolysing)